jgi:hypothetical protein
MSIDPFFEHPEPDPGEHAVPDLEAQARAQQSERTIHQLSPVP